MATDLNLSSAKEESAMSKNNNVNPGQYKVAGRERQGEDIVHDRQKDRLAKSRKKQGTNAARNKRKG
jgi:hypothetical protein